MKCEPGGYRRRWCGPSKNSGSFSPGGVGRVGRGDFHGGLDREASVPSLDPTLIGSPVLGHRSASSRGLQDRVCKLSDSGDSVGELARA